MKKMRFIEALGAVEKNSSYYRYKIEGGDNEYNVGDTIWFSNDGTILEVSDFVEETDIYELLSMFENPSELKYNFERDRIL